MKTKEMQKAINLLNKFVDQKSNMPIMQKVLIETSKNEMIISGTDIVKYIKITLDYDGPIFKTLIEFGKLKKVFDSIRENEYSFKYNHEIYKLTIESKRKYTLNGDDDSVQDFPCFNVEGDKQIIHIHNKDHLIEKLKKLIPLTKIHTLSEQYDYVLISPEENGECLLASTDIHRLAITTTNSLSCEKEFSIHHSSVEILDLIDEEIKESYIFDEKKMYVKTKNTEMFLQIRTKTDFPNFKSVAGTAYLDQPFVNVDNVELKEFLETSLKFLKMPKSKLYPTTFNLKNSILSLKCENEENEFVVQAFTASIDVGYLKRTPEDVSNDIAGYSLIYLNDCFKMFGAKTVSFWFRRDLRPLFTKCDDVLYLVMPLNHKKLKEEKRI